MEKKRILIVDDEVRNTRLLKANLEQTNLYEVAVVNWPEDALSTALKFQPHLVLLDIIMPRMPGGNVAAAIQSHPDLKGTPIIFLTAAVRRHQVEEHEGIICEHPCLAKPSSMAEIVQLIEANLDRPGTGSVQTAVPEAKLS